MAKIYFAEDKRIKLPELLAPAGNPEALEAAIEAGADAVYFGAGDFNARMRAKNFSKEELTAALNLCREYGVRSYVTVNTRLRDSELKAVCDLAGELYEQGADALIVADMGVAKVIREAFPDFELHASTQVSGHSSKDAEVLKNLGFSRMVCPREMSLEEICRLVKESPIEIEMFAHGAHCVSFSGQCMMSFAMGGRSGNRGMCAQPCRLPFRIEGVRNQYPLSLKDMSLAQSIPELIKSGVSSLKIEGRQKSARYVHGVVSVYRRLLDENRSAAAEEIKELESFFSRDGFTDGYLKKNYKGMLGVRRENEVISDRENTEKIHLSRKIPLDAVLTLRIGCPAELFVSDGKRSATVYGDTVTVEPDKKPIDRESAEKNMSRLGATAFLLDSFEFDGEEGSFITLSCINRMRREAVCALAKTERARPDGATQKKDSEKNEDFPQKTDFQKSYAAPSPRKGRRQLYTAEFLHFEDVSEKAKEFFDIIYLPIDEFDEIDKFEKTDAKATALFAPFLYPLTFDGEREDILKKLFSYGEKAKELQDTLSPEVMINGLGQAKLVREANLIAAGSFRFNITNKEAAETVLRFTENLCISPEAPMGLLKDTGKKTSAVIYGKIPLMHTQRCMLSNGGASCPFAGAGGRIYPHRQKKAKSGTVSCDGRFCKGSLFDRKNADFDIIGLPDCTNIIYNSVPVYMGDKLSVLETLPAGRYHFIFTTESKKECDSVIDGYEKRKSPVDTSKIKRLR